MPDPPQVMKPPTRLAVLPWQAGLRLDQFLAAVTALSRRRARSLAGEGRVLVNGRPRRVLSRALELGDVIDLLGLEEDPGVPRAPDLPPVAILHEDPWLLAADKPSGILSQPAERRGEGELAFDEQVLLHLALREGARPFLRLVHRIDRLVSGLLLFARSPAALPPLDRAWREERVERVYRALVEGKPRFEAERVEAAIARAPGGAWRFEVSPGGKSAETEVRLLTPGEPFSLVECRLVTGRTHQVRVHLAHLGHPVAGDRLYGAVHPGPSRPLLHAAELTLPHPRTGQRLRLVSPLPEDFERFLGEQEPAFEPAPK